jgi:glycosyltransferase involved in cell wall biosynthesis
VPEKPKRGLRTFVKMSLLRMADYLLVTGCEGIKRISSWSNIDEARFRDFPYLSAIVNNDEMIEFNKYRSRCLQEGDKIKILISNRFEKRKGYHCVYEALKNLEAYDLEKFSFTIIGSGTEFEYYKRRFRELKIEVNFKFWVEYKEYLSHIKETDILIHASSHEPFGIPPVDAMAHGKLVIVSDEVMSTRDRISDRKNGYMFKANDSVGLAGILKLVCKDPKLIYGFGEQAFFDSKKYQLGNNLSVVNEIISS